MKKEELSRELLVNAASLSHVTLVCHQDTWALLHDETFIKSNELFPSPWKEYFPSDRVTSGEDSTVRVHLSGPHLAKVIERMWKVAFAAKPFKKAAAQAAGQATALLVYQRLANFVDSVDPGILRKSEHPTVSIDAGITGSQGE